MRIAPVSPGLLLELAVGAVAVLGLVYAYKKAKSAIPATLEYINPTSPNNIANQATNGVVSAVTGRDETLGGWIYDLTHADPMAGPAKVIDYSTTNTPLVAPSGMDFGQLSG